MKRRKKRNLRRIVILLIAADLLLLAGLGVLFLGSDKEDHSQRDALAQLIGPEADEMDEAEFEESRLQMLSDALLLVSYNPEAQLINGGIDLYLSNREDNICSVSVELKILPDNRVIASTGLIDPGYRLERLDCDAKIAPGEYTCLMVMQVFAEDGTHFGKAGRHLMLSVK